MKRVDFSWEQGFLTPEKYVMKRNQLQDEINSLMPLDYDELVAAADLLENFGAHWKNCAESDNPKKERQSLLGEIVDKVFVCDGNVAGVTLKEKFSVILNNAHHLQRCDDFYILTDSLEFVPGTPIRQAREYENRSHSPTSG